MPDLVRVTDHAVLLYIERRMSVDVEAIRAEIAASCRRGVEAGAPWVTHQGVRFVLAGATVMTTLRKEWVWHIEDIRLGHAIASEPE